MKENLNMTVTVELGREVREVKIERLSPNHCWFTKAAVVCKFPSGKKIHTERRPQVCERDGKWFFPRQVIHNRHVTPFAFADSVQANSKWTDYIL